MGTFLHNCVKVHEPIELSFEVSGVGRGMGVLDGGPHAVREWMVSGFFSFHWFEWHIFEQC